LAGTMYHVVCRGERIFPRTKGVKMANTFPKLSKVNRANFDMHLASMTMVPEGKSTCRPIFEDLFVGGGLNYLPVITTPGKVGNASWRNLHSNECHVYADESGRAKSSENLGSNVETLRAYLHKRIAVAYSDSQGEAFPVDAVKMTVRADGKVEIWRVK
jgi:hypothetical protein